MPRPIPQAGRAMSFLSIPFLLAVPATSVPAQGTVIEEGSVVTGPVETRNEPIRVEADATIDGAVRTRNGPITIGAGSEVGPVSTRNGRIHGNVDTRTGGVVARAVRGSMAGWSPGTVPSASSMPGSAGTWMFIGATSTSAAQVRSKAI